MTACHRMRNRHRWIFAQEENKNRIGAHVVAISMDKKGYASKMFTTNRWVTDETWYDACTNGADDRSRFQYRPHVSVLGNEPMAECDDPPFPSADLCIC